MQAGASQWINALQPAMQGIQGGGGWSGAVGSAISGFLTPEQMAAKQAVSANPAQAAEAVSTNHFTAAQAPQPAAGGAPAQAPAPAPAPAPAAASGTGAAPGAAPSTAPTSPADLPPGSSYSSTAVTGGVGDPEVDAALKGAVLDNLKNDPFGPEKLAAAKAEAYDQGMAGLGSELESIDADLVRRGISRSGTAAQLGGEARQRAQANVASQQRQTMTEFAKLSSEHKQQAIGAAQNLASDLAQRGISMEQLKLQREQAAAGRGGGGYDPNRPIELVDDEGNVTQVDPRLLDLALGMFEGGYE